MNFVTLSARQNFYNGKQTGKEKGKEIENGDQKNIRVVREVAALTRRC
jgi:hypothetical protein